MPRNPQELSRPSQLLIRNIDQISGSDILVIGLPETETFEKLKEHLPDATLTLYEYEYAAYRRMKSLHDNTVYGPWYPTTGQQHPTHDTAIIYLPKSDALIRMILRMVNTVMAPNAMVYVIGEKNSGIKSAQQDITEYIGEISYSDAARHSNIFGAPFTATPLQDAGLDAWQTIYTTTIHDTELNIASLPGVFSHGRLDDGTQLLLENLVLPHDGARVLDWGCGAGIIGAYVKQRWNTSAVEMVDSNAFAIEAARRTIELNNIPGTLVYPTDVFSDIDQSEQYDLIISNPPFHGGVETDYSMAERFIAESYTHLEKGGRLLIVANIFLRYKPLIEQRFQNCKVIAQNTRYRLLEALR